MRFEKKVVISYQKRNKIKFNAKNKNFMLEELRRHNAIVQERIMKSFGYADTEDFIQKGEDEVELIQKGEIEYDWELEKAVYADTAQNRRLNRVGQEYHRGRKKKNMDDGNEGGSGKLSSQASKTDTSTLKKVANSDKAPQAMKDAAKKELQNRGEGGNKPESSRQKESRLRKEVREFLKKTGTKLNTPKFYNKVKEIMERENVDSHIMSQAVGKLYKTSGEMADAYGVIREMEPDGVKEEKKRKIHEEVKKDVIKDILKNGAGSHDDRFIDNNKTDYYKSVMKEYGVSDVGELADKLGEEGDKGYRKYAKIYTNMLKQIPPSAFHKEYGD